MKKCMIASLIIVFVMLLPMHAKAMYVNYFHDLDYGDTEEHVEEYEQILIDHGYVCVTKGCTDNPEWTDHLLADEGFLKKAGIYLDGDGKDYRLYLDPFDYEEYIKYNNNQRLINNAYGVSYYAFHHANEQGATNGPVGDEVERLGIPYGYITIYVNADDYLKADPNLVYSIILKGLYTDTYYDLSTNKFGKNGYVVRTKLPVDEYSVYSIFVDNNHIVDLSANESETFEIKNGVNHDFIIGFKMLEGDAELASGEKVIYNPENTQQVGKIMMEDGVAIKMIEPEAKETPKWIYTVITLVVLIIISLPVYLIVKKKMRDRGALN